MPLIDDIGAIPFSVKKQTNQLRNGGFEFSTEIIDTLGAMLPACDWDLREPLSATAVIEYPLGFPTFPTLGSGPCGCCGNAVTIVIPGATFGYSPYVAGQSPVGTTCFQFPLGTSVLGSLTNLASAISATSPYNATVTAPGGSLIITLEAKVTGPSRNYDTIIGDGRFGVTGGKTLGGGYIVRSNGSSVYEVTITGQWASGAMVQFDVSMTGGHNGVASYLVDAHNARQYTIVANPFSFALFDGIGVSDFAVFSPKSSASEGFDSLSYAVCVVAPGNLQQSPTWDNWISSAVSLDAPVQYLGYNLGVLALRGIPLQTLDGRPIAIAAYLMMPAASGVPYVVGKLWDCLVLSDFVDVGGTYQNLGRNYICIGSQDGSGGRTRASLLFCIADNGQ